MWIELRLIVLTKITRVEHSSRRNILEVMNMFITQSGCIQMSKLIKLYTLDLKTDKQCFCITIIL